MTLTELAHELRKVIKFKYVTVENVAFNDLLVCFWNKKPSFFSLEQTWLGEYLFTLIYSKDFNVNLDLSEYKDALDEINYSRCIVEVE